MDSKIRLLINNINKTLDFRAKTSNYSTIFSILKLCLIWIFTPKKILEIFLKIWIFPPKNSNWFLAKTVAKWDFLKWFSSKNKIEINLDRAKWLFFCICLFPTLFLGVLNQNLRKQQATEESKTDRCWFSKEAQDLLMLFSLFSGKTDKRSFSCFWACGPCAKEGLQARRRIVVVTVNGHRDLHKQRIHCATCFTKNSVIQVGGLRFSNTVFENHSKNVSNFFGLP